MRTEDWARASRAGPESLQIGRRSFGLASWFVAYAVLGEAHAAAPTRNLPAQRWIDQQQEIARALAAGQITPRGWCDDVERLVREVDLVQLVSEIDKAALAAAPRPYDTFPHKREVRFLDETGAPRTVRYLAGVLEFAPTNVIAPHGHRNLVAASVGLKSSLRVRQYDRAADVDGAMVIRPSGDGVVGPGEVATMCDERNNIHWFVPHDGPAVALNVQVMGIDPASPEYDIRPIDPLAGRRRDDGWIEAPILSYEAAFAKYTAKV